MAPFAAAAVHFGVYKVLEWARYKSWKHGMIVSPLCMRSMGWRCIAEAAKFDELRPDDMALAGLRITGMELLVSSIVAVCLVL